MGPPGFPSGLTKGRCLVAKSGGQNNTIKIAVALVALVVAIALPAWYFMGSKAPSASPPLPASAQPTAEEQQQMQEYRERPPVPTQEVGA